MKNLSKFDLGMIIAFVVIGLIGGGVWYYLSLQLGEATQKASEAKTTFQRQSVSDSISVTRGNKATLNANIDTYQGLLDPLIKDKFFAKGNVLSSIDKQQDSVSWKHDLNQRIAKLATAAKEQGVTVPKQFFFGFSRYASTSPQDNQTVVLNKQLIAIEEICRIMIKAPIKNLTGIRRSFEEDPHKPGQGVPSGGSPLDKEYLTYFSYDVGQDYTGYPFEFDFDTSVEGMRNVMNDLLAGPYVFVVRSVVIENDKMVAPTTADLDKLAAPPADTSITDSVPGTLNTQMAANQARSPVYLFSNSMIHVKMRIDLIEWKGQEQ